MMGSFIYRSRNHGFAITPSEPPNAGELFVNHEAADRSGHLGHAMVEYADGRILRFYSNCSTDEGGHSAVGWMAYKRSVDGGKTWSAPRAFPYSKQLYDMNCGKTCLNEKAVMADDGGIVLFNLMCDVHENAFWEPYFAGYMKSMDGGETWSAPKTLCSSLGRVYDAHSRDGGIYVLHCSSQDATQAHNAYQLFVSGDCGETFFKKSDLPFGSDHYYGTMEWLSDGRLIAYSYSEKDEFRLDYVISEDFGATWSQVRQSFFDKRIRNPQMVRFKDAYFLFGRSGSLGPEEENGHNVVYFSEDGTHWSEGLFLRLREAGAGAYCNTLVTGAYNSPGAERLLCQSSFAYKRNQTNILHWWIDAVELNPCRDGEKT